MRPRHWILLGAFATVTACAGLRNRESDAQTLARYMDYAGQPVDSFRHLGRFSNWRALGRNKVVVWTNLNDAYLLTVQEPCEDLQFTNAIGFTSDTGTVRRGFDSVKVSRNETCRITEIRPVNYKELQAAKRAGG